MLKHINKIVSVYDRKTSMRLTDIEWKIIDEICYTEKLKRKALFEKIQDNRSSCLGMTPAIRLFSLNYYYLKSKPQPHKSSDSVEETLKELL